MLQSLIESHEIVLYSCGTTKEGDQLRCTLMPNIYISTLLIWPHITVNSDLLLRFDYRNEV